MSIAYFYKELWEREFVSARLSNEPIEYFEGTVQETAQELFPDVDVVSVFVNSPLGKDELDRFPDVRCVVTRSTGFDHIDLAETKRRGIVVMHVPGYGANTVAEHAFALLLALSRRIYDAYQRVSEEGTFAQDGLRGFDLAGKTLGVIGCGAIGRHVVHIGRGFDMRVVVSDPHIDAVFEKETGAHAVSLDTLLAESDVVTLHTPLTEGTQHMINKEAIQKMKRGAYLINTARGGLVETQALVWGLEEGIIAGAGLDVLEEEGDMNHEERLLVSADAPVEAIRTALANHYLIDHPRVLITPHIAFNTQEAIERILVTTVENINSFRLGNPQHIVT